MPWDVVNLFLLALVEIRHCLALLMDRNSAIAYSPHSAID